ncbi:MAG TPA: hypothetical protein DDW73_06435 [Rhizobium sp.]|jgi:hypothetical protein|nr:hypothetical protein [Rhizobium sp.]
MLKALKANRFRGLFHDQHNLFRLPLPFIRHICYTITRNVITCVEYCPVQDNEPLIPSLLARSALTRVGVALALIVFTWIGIQWAVALQ